MDKARTVLNCLLLFALGRCATSEVNLQGVNYHLARFKQSCQSLCHSLGQDCLATGHGMEDSQTVLFIFKRLLGFTCKTGWSSSDDYQFPAQPNFHSRLEIWRERCTGFKNIPARIECGTVSVHDGAHRLCPCQKKTCKRVSLLGLVSGKALKGHVLESSQVRNKDVCQLKCVAHDYCVSYNLGPLVNGRHLCEISRSDEIKDPRDMETREGFVYQGTKNPCSIAQCLRNQSCLPFFDTNRHQCVCPAGYKGDKCEQDIDECDTTGDVYNCDTAAVCTNSVGSFACACKPGFSGNGKICLDIDECEANTDNCLPKATCTNTDGSFQCACKAGYKGDGVNSCDPYKSCEEVADNDPSAGDGKYKIVDDTGTVREIYCILSSSSISPCSGRGWTLVMRLNGDSENLKYDSVYWTDKNTFQPEAANGLQDSRETKTEAYWLKPFTKICLGMKVTGTSKFAELSHNASSLHSVISSGAYVATYLPKSSWLSMLHDGGQLQNNCNQQGFNNYYTPTHHARGRIGLMTNNENDCRTIDTYIAFGGHSWGCQYRHTRGFTFPSSCFILVR